MKPDTETLSSVMNAAELNEVKEVVGGDSVIGFAILDTKGARVDSSGVSEIAVGVFSNIFEQAEKVGLELGEAQPRPAIMFSGSEMELLALPLTHASVIVVKEKAAGIRREYRRAS